MEEEIIVLRPQVMERFQAAMERGRVVLFSAPCGFGKTTLATRLLAGRRVYSCSGLEPRFDLPRDGEGWVVLLVDDLQELDDSEQQAVCELIRTSQDKRFVLLTRGATPGWLMPFQFTGLMTQIQTKTLFFDRENTAQLLERPALGLSWKPSRRWLRAIRWGRPFWPGCWRRESPWMICWWSEPARRCFTTWRRRYFVGMHSRTGS